MFLLMSVRTKKKLHEQAATDDICGEIDDTISIALSIICNPQYHLLDAFSELCKLYSIAVAIPVPSCTAERSFSALIRVKTLTMVQKRLEGLMLMAVEQKLLMSISNEAIVQQLAQSSSELSRALTLTSRNNPIYLSYVQLAHAHACTAYIFHTYERSLRGCAGGEGAPKYASAPPANK